MAILVTVFALLATGCSKNRSAKLTMVKVALDDVPETVRAASQKALPDVKFSGAWKNLDRDGEIVSYEIKGTNERGKIREVRISLAGEVLEME
jgi:hypothetical protein